VIARILLIIFNYQLNTTTMNDLVGLSQPLTKLVEVISEGIGRVSRSYLIRREAEARAHEIRVISQAIHESQKILPGASFEGGAFIAPSTPESVQLNSLLERAKERQSYQQIQKQVNLESICAVAFEELEGEEMVPEEKPGYEWISRFFEIAGDIRTEHLQYWWGRILSGELKSPASFSLRTLDVLKNLSYDEAVCFERVGQYIISCENYAFIWDPFNYVFKRNPSINSDVLSLEDAGLMLNSATPTQWIQEFDSQKTKYECGRIVFWVEGAEFPSPAICKVHPLTTAGRELLRLIDFIPDMGYVKAFCKELYRPGVKISWAQISREQGALSEYGDVSFFDFEKET
jgi:hypothetical protein